MPGHVFITQGDLTKLACDAWLLPCDASRTVEPYWFHDAPAELRAWQGGIRTLHRPEDWSDRRTRVLPLPEWRAGACRPWLVNVGNVPDTDPAWYAEGVRQFVRAAGGSPERGTPAFKRSRRLLALPLVGTGQGGAQRIKGEVIQAVLQVLYEETRSGDFDVVLVTHTPAALTAAQSARQQLQNSGGRAGAWPALDEDLAGCARALAQRAVEGHLVLFLGAGVSAGAGFPSWSELLEQLAREAGFPDNEQRALRKLSYLDQARIIEGRLVHQGKHPNHLIADRFRSAHYPLAHALLAALPVNEVVTTNYDTLFEMASEAIAREPAVIPYQSAVGGGRWLLKMHGCIQHPEDIVLTREDYLRYADRRSALAGIVQALLITRHMLFVGFSLTDDNFHRIADAVRKAVRPPGREDRQPRPFGTALLLFEDALMQELWQQDVACVALTNEHAEEAGNDDTRIAAAARQLEIFLDRVLAEATRAVAHVLDPTYSAVLSADERELKEILLRFKRDLERHRGTSGSSPAWATARHFLESLGGMPSRPPAAKC